MSLTLDILLGLHIIYQNKEQEWFVTMYFEDGVFIAIIVRRLFFARDEGQFLNGLTLIFCERCQGNTLMGMAMCLTYPNACLVFPTAFLNLFFSPIWMVNPQNLAPTVSLFNRIFFFLFGELQ